MSETSERPASAQRPGTGAQPDGSEGGADAATIPVAGMTCAGCADNVHLALSQVEGVARVEVDVEQSVARVQRAAEGGPDEAALRAAVEGIGYDTREPSAEEAGAEAASRRWKPLAAVGVLLAALVLGMVAFRSVSDAYDAAGTLAQLNAVFDEVSLVALGLALVIGLVVAFAPSSLAMAPAIMGYISTTGAGSARRAAGLSALFLGGMLVTNMVVGALFALGGKAVMSTVSANLPVWYSVVAVVLVVMALVLLGVWRPRLPSWRPSVPSLAGRAGGSDGGGGQAGGGDAAGGRRRAGGALALGVPFGLMACPSCTPLLMPLALGAAATANPVYGAGLLGVFALGRGVPMVVLGTFTGTLQGGGSLARSATIIQRVVGVLLLAAAAWFVVSALTFAGAL